MDHITVSDGTRIAYQWDGRAAAPILLLSNSLGTNLNMWEPQIAAFITSFRILRYDMRGLGASDSPAGAYSMDRLGRDVIELLDSLNLHRVHFCGLSLGGMVGQWLAVHAPDRINRLVLANTSACMAPPSNWQSRIESVMTNGVAPLAEASLARWFTPGFAERNPAAAAAIRSMLLANNPVGYAGCCAAIRDMDQRPTSRLNTLPTLVVAGSLDPATKMEDGAYLADSAAYGKLCVLEAAHLSNVECPDAFNTEVMNFLALN